MGLGPADNVAGLGGNGRVVWCRVLGSLDDWATPESSDTRGLHDRDELRAHCSLLLERRTPALAVGRRRLVRSNTHSVRQRDLNAPHVLELRRRVIETATAILECRLCITEGARVLGELAFDLLAQRDESFVVFIDVDSETDVFPLGDARAHWHASALVREDASRRLYEETVRSRVNRACSELIRHYRWPSVV